MKKILHIVTDEKFTDYAIRQFSAPEMCSEFILIPSNDGNIKVKLADQCTIVRQSSEEFKTLLQNLGNYSAVVLHGMHWPVWQKPLLKAMPDGVKVAWVFWGGELYGQPDIANSFLAPVDKCINTIHELQKKLLDKKQPPIAFVPKEYYSRVDYCLTAMPVEYEFAKSYLNRPDMKYLWYNYYSIEETMGSVFDKQCHGSNIWIGNSATISCNYFDTILKLRKIDVGDREVIVPLSYGSPWLMNYVPRVYRRVFGDKFKPLMDFVQRDEYNEKMLSCNVMIQPHYLSQGVGNILTGLWLGMRVYISEKCITADYLKQIGVTFFTIEHDLRKSNPDVFAPLPQFVIDHNRQMLLKETSMQRTIEANIQLVEELTRR